MNPQSTGTPSSDRPGNGSMSASGALGGGTTSNVPESDLAAAGASGMGTGGPGGAGTFPDPSAPGGAGQASWTRSDETHRSEFGAFLDDLSELARGGGHGTDLRGEIERRVSQARSRMSAALDQGAEMSARAREQMHRGLEVSRDAVAERPLSYLAMAAVGGLIVGLLLSRRD
jgi:ElaB/YqjD/DUF883 family membrane-anchored ribosome-binding protein